MRATGRIDEAIALFRGAAEQDPLSSTAHHNLAVTYYAAGRLEEAEATFRKALELAPKRAETRSDFAMVLLRLRRSEEALAEATRESHDGFGLWARSVVHHALGNRGQSDRELEDLIERFALESAYQIAETHAARGEMDAAFEWLDRAYAQNDGGLMYLLGDPLFTLARQDPRWDAFLLRMGLRTRGS
jgi:tetratricopeptide (TPR) repeat protein